MGRDYWFFQADNNPCILYVFPLHYPPIMLYSAVVQHPYTIIQHVVFPLKNNHWTLFWWLSRYGMISMPISQSYLIISLCVHKSVKLICFSPSKLHIYHTIQTLIIYPQTSIRPWQSHPSMNVTYPTFVVIILFCSFRSIPCDLVRLLVVSIEFLIYKVCILYRW